jgi:chromatin remodeling complex protein RSC6
VKKATDKSKKTTKEVPAPVVETTPVAPVVAAAPEENKIVETSEVLSKLLEVTTQMQQIGTIYSAVKSNIKVVEKAYAREIKAAQKSAGKNKKKKDGSNRKLSGFNIPTLISDELATFLGKDTGTKMARVEVTNAFNAYIKSNNLHDPTNGRYILPDAALTRLLQLTPTDRLSYFNLQAFIKHHFIKETPVAVAPVV